MTVVPSSFTSASTSLPKTFLVRRGMIRLINAAIDTPSEVLDEGTEQTRIGVSDGKIPIDQNFCFPHGLPSGALDLVR